MFFPCKNQISDIFLQNFRDLRRREADPTGQRTSNVMSWFERNEMLRLQFKNKRRATLGEHTPSERIIRQRHLWTRMNT